MNFSKNKKNVYWYRSLWHVRAIDFDMTTQKSRMKNKFEVASREWVSAKNIERKKETRQRYQKKKKIITLYNLFCPDLMRDDEMNALTRAHLIRLRWRFLAISNKLRWFCWFFFFFFWTQTIEKAKRSSKCTISIRNNIRYMYTMHVFYINHESINVTTHRFMFSSWFRFISLRLDWTF